MLLVVLHAGNERFGLEAGRIVEIVPLVRLTPVRRAPAWVAGLFNYRGRVTPVVDLCMLLGGQPARHLLSTRILLAHYTGAAGGPRVLGLLAERVLETVDCDDGAFQDAGVTAPGAPCLGDVLADADGMLRRITVDELLPADVRELLFAAGREGP